MNAISKQEFGETIRKWRAEKDVTLRKFAEMVGISPTYLSKIERGDFEPPAEDKIRAIAKALGKDEDEVLGLAGRISSDLSPIIRRHPVETASFLRTAQKLSPEDWRKLTQKAEQLSKEGGN